uniref:Uncharacterized protein n=1 Tax=Anopheles dirus TaxID=7168 RepID=A0A182NX49_9DIPT
MESVVVGSGSFLAAAAAAVEKVPKVCVVGSSSAVVCTDPVFAAGFGAVETDSCVCDVCSTVWCCEMRWLQLPCEEQSCVRDCLAGNAYIPRLLSTNFRVLVV